MLGNSSWWIVGSDSMRPILNPVPKDLLDRSKPYAAKGVEFGDVHEGLQVILERELAAAPEFVRRIVEQGMPVA